MTRASSPPSGRNPIPKDPLLKKLEWSNWGILAFLWLAGWLLFPPAVSWGILLGGLVSIVNFHWLYRDLRRLFEQTVQPARGRILLKYYLRFAVTAVVLFFIITNRIVDVIGLLVGLSVIVINILVTVFLLLAKKKPIEEVS